jgi:hypothetical protein
VLINGDMRIDQRNAGAAQTFTAGSALAYSVDRWFAYCTGANVTGQRVAGGDGGHRYSFTGASGNTGFAFGQRIEAENSFHLSNAAATLSVKVASSVLTSLGWALYKANTADAFGTLASPTHTLLASGSFAVSGTETLQSAQISVPSGATTGMEIIFTAGALGAGQTLTLGDVQLEPGATATPFERVKLSAALADCQRYRWTLTANRQIQGFGTGSGYTTYADIAFPVKMRATPTLSPQWSNGANENAYGCMNVGADGYQTYVTAAGTGGYAITHSAGSAADAEL